MIVCNRCGKENQDHYKFCLGCGAELSSGEDGSVGTMKTMMAESGARPAPTPPGGVPHGARQGGTGPGPGFGMPPGGGLGPGPGGFGARAPAGPPPGVGAPGGFGGPTPGPGPAGMPPGGMPPGGGFGGPRAATPNPGWGGAPQGGPPPGMVPLGGPPPGGPGMGPPMGAAPMGAAAPAASAGPRKCPTCGSDVPPNFKFCGVCGSSVPTGPSPAAAAPAPSPGGGYGGAPGAAPGYGAPAPFGGPTPARAPEPRALITLIRPDGSEGGTFNLREGENKIGREHGAIFESDGYLSPTHCDLIVQGNGAIVRDLDSLNGVFVRMIGEEEIHPGQIIRMGQELLRFDLIEPPQPLEDGTEVMGSPNPGFWGKITVIIGSGVDGSAYPLLGDSITLGRERGDINFPDDGYVSGLHARLSTRGGKVYLADLGSSNGSFLRVQGERKIANESFVLLGQQLFRLTLR